MPSAHERIFLGYEPVLLQRAAAAIVERFGRDLGGLLVALPGTRAARALREHLARRTDSAAVPPRVLTQGELTDELVQLDRPVAGRLVRTLAWARALRALPKTDIEAITARPPERADLRGWTRLAEVLRALHAELAQEGIDFARVASDRDLSAARAGGTGEAARWRALAGAQELWRRELDTLHLADPHESRFRAIEAGAVDRSRSVALVGVSDANHLVRRALGKLGGRVTAFVFAPQAEADAFDEIGCVRTASWKDRDLAIPLDLWDVAEGPADQAVRTRRRIASWDGRFAPEDVTIGVCDEEVAPYLERQLGEAGVAVRDAAGTRLERTRPYRLLADVAAWLPRRAFAPYAALVRRDPWPSKVPMAVGAAKAARAAEAVGLEKPELAPHLLDRYHEEHLPAAIDGRWLGDEGAAIRPVHASLEASLGDLASETPRPLAEWPAAVRSFLTACFSAELDPAVEDARVLVEALTLISDALGEIESLPGELGKSRITAAEALDLLLAMTRADAIAPRPETPGESAVELMGWLELPLDEAGALVVTGFEEGFVPRSRRGDAFLPDSLRRRLGLPSAEDRVARDLYAATVLLRSKAEAAFVSGRRSRDGDPLLPSRLLFHVPRKELLERATWYAGAPGSHALGARVIAPVDTTRSAPGDMARNAPGDMARGAPGDVARGAPGPSTYRLPRIERAPVLDALWVTAFRDYLCSPYGFYLKHVLGLETLDDTAREMDARQFGSFAHRVLQEFGERELRDSTDARAVEAWLREKVEALALERFGARPLPAVDLQIAQLARRLALFARAQAARAAQGWKIHRVEWKPSEPVFLAPDGAHGNPAEAAPMRLLGKIDRIDVREVPGSTALEWAILDYKTTAVAKDPGPVHCTRGGEWRDLQLPLYTLLARELGPELGVDAMPSLGYFTIGKDEAETLVRLADWEEADLESAYEAAGEVVRRVRAGRFFDLGRQFRGEPILLAIAGQGLVAGPEAETGDENGDRDGAGESEGGGS